MTHIARESEDFLTAALAGSMDTRVTSCPGWTMTDLVGHLGVVQWFHGGHLTRGITDPPPGPRPDPPDSGLADWMRTGTATLLANLAGLPDDAPAWTFQRGNATVGFWRRRMAHEAAIHRWDAQFARGRAEAFLPELARDGIDEYLAVFLARKPAETRADGTVILLVDDGARRFVTTHGDARASAVTMSGPADSVWLTLWGRRPLTDLDVDGDLALAASVINA